MAKGSTKFGTFGGVFVPSILTILGVIMYLRLPMVVGNAGLWMALGIILTAHVISVTTGLSISSIATDKKVGAGGPYYIVSRSLGLSIGGTLGIALFVGLSFSVSLYVIGFSESFLATLGLPNDINTIRLCGTITVIVVAGITLISTALAIKTQYIILFLIAASLIAIFLGLGDTPAPQAPLMDSATGPDVKDFGTLFGIFFPAVTGFTAGVNMSGDLKDPKKSIPFGTMAAIGAGMAVYVGLAFFLAFRVNRTDLMENTQLLSVLAGSTLGLSVVAGIWGATLSSAMGSILGAPRILQALSVDRVLPGVSRFFAKGAGKSNEPRRALFLAFAIAEFGILLGELDVIARIVSIFFMATYGFLNLSCAIESWASPDFRPSFKIPKMVSVIGGFTCLVLMIALDMMAMAATILLFLAVFALLKRRELTLESGDTWAGVLFSMVRSNLTRLTRYRAQTRDFRPNVLCFSLKDSPTRQNLIEFGETLVRRQGVLTDLELFSPEQRASLTAHEKQAASDETPPGMFYRPIEVDDPHKAVGSLIQYSGFPGLEPNSIMLSWGDFDSDSAKLTELIKLSSSRDLNTMIVAPNPDWEVEGGTKARIDLWWAPQRGNFSFLLTLARYITSGEPWQLATVRFLIINDHAAKTETLYRTASRLCTESRVEASIKVLNNTLGDVSFEDWIRRESSDADIVILGLPNEIEDLAPNYFDRSGELHVPCGTMMLVRGSSLFPEVLQTATASRLAEAAATPSGEDTLEVVLPKIDLPAVPELANEVMRFAGRIDAAGAEFEEGCLAPAYRIHKALVEQLSDIVKATFTQIKESVDTAGHRQRKNFSRSHNLFLQQSSKLLGDFERDDLSSLKDSLEHRIEWFLGELARIKEGIPQSTMTVYRNLDESPDDEETEGKKKRKKKRMKKAIIPLEALEVFYLDSEAPQVLSRSVKEIGRFSSQSAIRLAKAINSVRVSLDQIAGKVRSGTLTHQIVDTEQEEALKELDALIENNDASRRTARKDFLKSCRQLSIELTWDLNRPDLRKWTRQQRRVDKKVREIIAALPDAPGTWIDNESLLIRRAELELLISSFQARLATIADRTKDTVSVELRGGVSSQIEELLASLHALLERIKHKGIIKFEGSHDLGDAVDDKKLIDDLVKKTQAATGTLPESFDTLNEESILTVEEDPFEEVESIAISVRRRVEFLVQAEFVGRLQEGLSQAASAEGRALGVARDVLRLISFNINDLLEEEEDERTFRDRMIPIIVEGLGRLEGELSKVRTFSIELTKLIENQLLLVKDKTDAYAITGSEDGLRQYVAAEGARQQAMTRFQQVSRIVQRFGRDAFIKLLYRRSAGMVRVHQLRSGLDQQENIVDQIFGLVHKSTPVPEVLEELPFFYQQPFLGKTRISADFWVGREQEMKAASRAVDHAKQGGKGAIFITGKRNSGKSAFCRAVANSHFKRDRIYHILPPPGGTTSPTAFKQAIEVELGAQGDYPSIFAAIPESSIVVFHDLELWWQRSSDGLRVLDTVRRLIEKHSGSCTFMLNINIHSLRFINRLIPLNDQALSIIECGPIKAEILKEIVMLRHRSTGLSFNLGDREEDEVAEWRLARLFSRHFDYSGGTVGVALQSWISHISEVDKRTIDIRSPERPNTEILYELPMEWVSLLLELSLHNQATFARLKQITEIDRIELRHQLNTLTRMGLVGENKQGVIEVNRYVEHFVTSHLVERGILV